MNDGKQSKKGKEPPPHIKTLWGKDYVDAILNRDRDPKEYNQHVDNIKKFVEARRSITPSQLRNIFTLVKRAKDPLKLAQIRPQLAYAAGRSQSMEMQDLVAVLDELIRNVNEDNISELQSFFEAFVAYHRFYNPKDF